MADRRACPGCRDSIIATPSRRLPAHPDPATGVRCQGSGLRLDRAAYTQYVELFGQERADEIMRSEQPDQTPPTAQEQS